MIGLRAVVVVALAVCAIVLETAVLARTSLPGPTPDLVALVVIGIAVALGANAGALSGFGAGLLLALAPPADAPIGLAAILYAVVGYLVGARAAGERLARGEVAGIAAAAGATLSIVGALVAGLWGDGWPGPVAVLLTAGMQAVYCAALGALVTPAVGALVAAVPGRSPA